MINTTSWPQWMRIDEFGATDGENEYMKLTRASLRQALRLLAEAAEALEIAEAAAIVIHRANDVPYCQKCRRPAEELHGKECTFAVLDRIRTGGGGE